MLTHCLKCKKICVNSKGLKAKNGRTVLISIFAICSSKIQNLLKFTESQDLLKVKTYGRTRSKMIIA